MTVKEVTPGDTFVTQKQRESEGMVVNPQPLREPESGF